MNKYWALSLAFFAILIGSTVVIKTSYVAEGLVLGESSVGQRSLINPTEYIRKLTEAPVRKLTQTASRPSINPTEYIQRLTGTPPKTLIGETKIKNASGDAEYKPKLKGTPLPSLTGLAEKKQRLADEKLKICQEKSKKILERSSALSEKAIETEKKFTAIVSGVKEYYVKKNLLVENYEELLASVEEKKNAIAPLVEAAKTSLELFSCTGENPSEKLRVYHEDMQAVLAALHEYRISIKNLITVIKESLIIEPTSTNSVSPISPTVAPL